MTASDSLILSALGSLFVWLKTVWRESLVGRALHRLWQGIWSLVRGSAICRFLWREGASTKRWEDSLFRRLIDFLLDLVPRFFRFLHRSAPDLIEGSLFLRLVGALQSHMHVLLGLFFFAMLVAPHSLWNNLYGFMGALVLTAVFYLSTIIQPKVRLSVRHLSVFLVAYAMLILYGYVFSDVRYLSFRFLCFHITCLLVVLLMVSAIESYRQFQTLLLLLMAGLVIASLYGCYQRMIGIEVIASQQDLRLNEGMPGRVYSFFDNPNNFAEILVMILPFFLTMLLNLKSAKGKCVALLAAVPCLVAIGMTYSRSSWIGLALAVVVFMGMQNWRFIPLVIVLGLAAFPFLPQTIINRIFTIGNMEDSSTRYRFAIYEAVGNLLKDRGITGIGLGSDVVKEAFQGYPTMFDGSYPIHSHNNYLQVWCEMGALGLVSFLALLLYQLKSGVRAFYRGYGSREVKNVLAAAVGGFCGILVISIAEYSWFYPRNMLLFWLLFAIIAVCVKLGKQSKEKTA